MLYKLVDISYLLLVKIVVYLLCKMLHFHLTK